MADREKVIKGLEEIANDKWMKTHADWYVSVCSDALELLKEQEHKDKMFHALEDDWKRLKELLKEKEAVIKQYHKADSFLDAHGWSWEGR